MEEKSTPSYDGQFILVNTFKSHVIPKDFGSLDENVEYVTKWITAIEPGHNYGFHQRLAVKKLEGLNGKNTVGLIFYIAPFAKKDYSIKPEENAELEYMINNTIKNVSIQLSNIFGDVSPIGVQAQGKVLESLDSAIYESNISSKICQSNLDSYLLN